MHVRKQVSKSTCYPATTYLALLPATNSLATCVFASYWFINSLAHVPTCLPTQSPTYLPTHMPSSKWSTRVAGKEAASKQLIK